jgi:hypothetical protein
MILIAFRFRVASGGRSFFQPEPRYARRERPTWHQAREADRKAAERLELKRLGAEKLTIADDSVLRKVIPHGAIIYDTKGQT